MSDRLLALGKNLALDIHTPIDDIEGFVWVLNWAVHSNLANTQNLKTQEFEAWLEYEDPLNDRVKSQSKRQLLMLTWYTGTRPGTPVYEAWRPLIHGLNEFLNGLNTDFGRIWNNDEATPSQLDQLVASSYEKLANFLLSYLDNESFLVSAHW